MPRPQIKLPDVVSIAFETNGRGYLGFLVELPGAFIRGRTENEAIVKVDQEVNSYLKWLGIEKKPKYKIQVIQRHRSSLMVEDADNEILLKADKGTMSEEEFKNYVDIAWYSGETFSKIYNDAKFKGFVDETRIRKTFYGENPKTIQEIFDHVKRCQYYYLSKTKIEFEEKEENFMEIREFCLQELKERYRKNNKVLS